ncbi:MAG: 2Fe-2S iron-sulfur cluster-binding protein [Cyanobacteria bacterium P01_H01_bin.121]
MTTHQVTLINREQNFEQTIEVPADESILLEAGEYGIKIPFECVTGGCATCEGRLVSGTVDQSAQMYLTEQEMAEGRVITCVAKPTSDCTLEVELGNYL